MCLMSWVCDSFFMSTRPPALQPSSQLLLHVLSSGMEVTAPLPGEGCSWRAGDTRNRWSWTSECLICLCVSVALLKL